jgi:hypothetical protein
MKSRNAIANEARDQRLATGLRLGYVTEGERHAMNAAAQHIERRKRRFSAIERTNRRFLAMGRIPPNCLNIDDGCHVERQVLANCAWSFWSQSWFLWRWKNLAGVTGRRDRSLPHHWAASLKTFAGLTSVFPVVWSADARQPSLTACLVTICRT